MVPSVAYVPGEASRAPSGPDDAAADRFRSLFVIGRGGMGRVEVALERCVDGLERVAALKRLLPEVRRDPRHEQMFLREARLAMLLEHPNVVHAHAVGELDGELFLAMQYVEGEPLSRVLAAAKARAGPLDPALVAYALAHACDGLHAAHELCDADGKALHVIHRDISPHNIMVSYHGDIKILDFGVAKFDTSDQATRTGEVKGKMAYMSPEQALGEPVDRRSDLFSVGAVLFESLTGRRMWGDGTDLELMRRLALEEPPHLGPVGASAPAALVDLHARLVARDPQRRPSTAREVADQLRAFAAAPGTARSASTASMRALMMTLFREEAERGRARLTEALQKAVPSPVVALGPRPAERGTPERPPAPPLRDAIAGPSSTARRTKMHGVLALTALAISLGLGSMALPRNRKTTPTSAPSARAAVPTASEAPTAITPPPSVSVVPIATADEAAAATSATSSASSRRVRPAFPRPGPVKSAPAPSKLPDVDPSPF